MPIGPLLIEAKQEYGERCNADGLHFVVFDRSKKTWSKKIFKRTRKLRGATIKVWGM